MIQIICQSENGKVFNCTSCKLIHFEYKNLNFNFTTYEYEFFSNYFLNLNGEYWEIENANCFFERKILIPAGTNNFNILLNNEELFELKEMFSKTNYKKNIPSELFKDNFSNN